jgi:hypothetical protein
MELVKSAVAAGQEVSASAAEFTGFHLTPSGPPRLTRTVHHWLQPNDSVWTAALRLESGLNLGADPEALARDFHQMAEEVLSPGANSELFQRPTLRICGSEDLEECLPRSSKRLKMVLQGGFVRVEFSGATPRQAQDVVSSVLVKCADYWAVRQREERQKTEPARIERTANSGDRNFLFGQQDAGIQPATEGEAAVIQSGLTVPETGRFFIIEPASLPAHPTSPNYWLLIGGFMIGGVALRLLLAFFARPSA